MMHMDQQPLSSAVVQQGMNQPFNDIVLQIGGPVWALDWCPQRPGWVHSGTEKYEFLAVGAHPSSAPYNRLGEPLKGHGILQIWAFDFSVIDGPSSDIPEVENSSWQPKTGRGSRGDSGLKSAGKTPRGTRMRGSIDISGDSQGDGLLLEPAIVHGVHPTTPTDNVDDAYVVLASSGTADHTHLMAPHSRKRPRTLKESARARGSDADTTETTFLKWGIDEGPAKMVLGLAHMGLVTWDAKWQPNGKANYSGDGRECVRLGFLALLLGDGSIQVFDVPLPSMFTTQFSKGGIAANEPEIVSIGAVLRCSDLCSGGHKSIPLAVEWSTWDPHDLILVGFHDATVGLWRFSSNVQKPETRPLMFFTADTLPLRSVAWAPDGSGSSGKHMFVTAGHSGWVKFWDVRDPFRPLWDLQVSRGCIHSLDWLPWPRCLVMALDDGTLRILGLDNASSQTPVTGEPWRGTHSQGLQCYLCSTCPIWDARVSRTTGLVAYAGANGSVLQFQLTEKAIVKEGARAREPHYLCGSFVADSVDGPVTLMSPKKTSPAQMKKSSTEWSSTPRTMRGFLATCTLDNESKQASGSTSALLGSSKTEGSPGPRIRKKHSKALGRIRNKVSSQWASQLKSSSEPETIMAADDSMALVSLETHALPGSGLNEEQYLPRAKNFRETNPPAAENFEGKKVAVHRLTWNCNKNRQHWLAYGGAAGIVRCQQVFSMKKK